MEPGVFSSFRCNDLSKEVATYLFVALTGHMGHLGHADFGIASDKTGDKVSKWFAFPPFIPAVEVAWRWKDLYYGRCP